MMASLPDPGAAAHAVRHAFHRFPAQPHPFTLALVPVGLLLPSPHAGGRPAADCPAATTAMSNRAAALQEETVPPVFNLVHGESLGQGGGGEPKGGPRRDRMSGALAA